ncbi:MAG: VanZ family protein, partial [Thermoanaerobaculia bacterium]|nr:VanZ family protein [Thermoanaerobaculia bacterium]
MVRLVPAIVVSALVIAVGPFVADIRDALKEGLGDAFRPVLATAFAVPVAAVVAAVVIRIRDDRVRRWALLVAGLGLMAGQLFGWNRPEADVNAVERIHFVFYGAVTVLFFRAYRHRGDLSTLALTWASAAIVAILDEGVQWASEVRTGEIFDVGINVYATVCTLLVCLAWSGPRHMEWRLPAASIAPVTRLLAVATVVLAAFLHLAHLGYETVDPDIGSFRSFFATDELRRVSRQRQAEWADQPPGPLAPLNLEDYFRTEAGWHVRHRNEALGAGDFYVAAKENDILEAYYAPFLDLPNAVGRPFAFNPDERRRTEAGRPRPDPYPYTSAVFREPLRIWIRPSKPVLWLVTAVAAGLLLAAPQIRRITVTGYLSR